MLYYINIVVKKNPAYVNGSFFTPPLGGWGAGFRGLLLILFLI